MGFLEPEDGSDIDPFDREMATMLLKALNRALTERSIKAHSTHFRRLRENDGIEQQEIRQVLQDHLANLDDKYQPQATTAQVIRKKWRRITSHANSRRSASAKPENATERRIFEAAQRMQQLYQSPHLENLPAELLLSWRFRCAFLERLFQWTVIKWPDMPDSSRANMMDNLGNRLSYFAILGMYSEHLDYAFNRATHWTGDISKWRHDFDSTAWTHLYEPRSASILWPQSASRTEGVFEK